jgi:hypothetical protein
MYLLAQGDDVALRNASTAAPKVILAKRKEIKMNSRVRN